MSAERPAPVDRSLLEFAAPSQRPVIEAYIECGGSNAAAARKLGTTSNAVTLVLKRVRARAAKEGFAPEVGLRERVPTDFEVKRLSQHYTQGELDHHWLISEPARKSLMDRLRLAVAEIAEPLTGKVKPRPMPANCNSDLLAVYPIGDAHIGLYAWAAESGDDHNLAIAEADLVTAMEQLSKVAPPADQGLLISVGDMNHADNNKNQTPQSGHQLDVDTRYAKVMAATLRTTERMIDLGLRKHKRMHVILARGNHDPHAAVMMALCVDALYRNEPRVTVDLSPSAFYWYLHGKCFIGVNHGDKVKPADMPLVMATDRPKEWAAATFRTIYGGHWHHDALRDFRGCTVETIRTLAAPDNYTAEGGWRSQRDMRCDVWHRNDGRIVRHTIGIQQIRIQQIRRIQAKRGTRAV